MAQKTITEKVNVLRRAQHTLHHLRTWMQDNLEERGTRGDEQDVRAFMAVQEAANEIYRILHTDPEGYKLPHRECSHLLSLLSQDELKHTG